MTLMKLRIQHCPRNWRFMLMFLFTKWLAGVGHGLFKCDNQSGLMHLCWGNPAPWIENSDNTAASPHTIHTAGSSCWGGCGEQAAKVYSTQPRLKKNSFWEKMELVDAHLFYILHYYIHEKDDRDMESPKSTKTRINKKTSFGREITKWTIWNTLYFKDCL